ncbi:MAG: thiamine pyrophosphate-dependent enzyme [Oscillospiraceae bacterium]|nr:thiamine pyrophosphate-dependent enzyme [Oscillospiraceae bacterium]
MSKKLLMGNEAIAFGALRAGVSVVTGYPGTPSSEILDTVAKNNDGSVYVEWSVNEKAALEVAAGAAYAGARVLVTMKQVGLNASSDPLMCLNYIGVKGGMVIVVADDPGPISSQTEQDTRHFAKYAKLSLFDPSTPEEAYTMIADAFEHSEKYGQPVLFRPTTRVCHSCASIDILDDLPKKQAEGFIKDEKWVIFPRLSYNNHIKIQEDLLKMREDFSNYDKNLLTGSGKKGIAVGGVSYSYTLEALESLDINHKLLKVTTFPFPDKLALEFLTGLDEVLVVEELDPVIEEDLVRLCGLHNLNVKIKGQNTRNTPIAGEFTPESVEAAICKFFEEEIGESRNLKNTPNSSFLTPNSKAPPEIPGRAPSLCIGCPHRASFSAVKNATQGISAVYTGDIGCYTLGNTLGMVDTCLCMGAGITIAQGLHRIEPDTVHFAFIGDSTFFHSGITGIVNAVYNQSDIIVVILDNSTTAMTGGQPHPGTGVTMMGNVTEKIDIGNVVEALNITKLFRVDPFKAREARQAVTDAMALKGVRVIIFESPCIML